MPSGQNRGWKRIIARYRALSAQDYLAIALSLALLIVSGAVSAFAIAYATEQASNPVTDLVLSNIPVFDVDGLFVFGTLFMMAFILLVLLLQPKRIPFSAYTLALFFFIRSGFVTLTHIGPFPIAPPDTNWGELAQIFLFSKDLFFSGHVGLSFLAGLMFWRQRILRYVFMLLSVYMSVVVLLGHYHYSIDVASAYFITYTIFCIAQAAFTDSLALFRSADTAPVH